MLKGLKGCSDAPLKGSLRLFDIHFNGLSIGKLVKGLKAQRREGYIRVLEKI